MDFAFNEEQLELRDNAVRFAQKALNEGIIERDRDSTFSHELWKQCAEFGVQGSAFPAEYGGMDLDLLTTMVLMEGLGYGCKDGGLLFAINGQMWTVQFPIRTFGTDAQKERYLRRLVSGDLIGAHGMTEPGSGSDAFGLTTTAVRQGDSYVLNGTKTFSTLAPVADLFLVFARTDRNAGLFGITAFLIERDFPGFSVGRPLEKMGLKTIPMAELFMEDCVVPVENRLGKEGNGAGIFDAALEWERSCILASLIGAMERQLETSIQYVNERHQFGQPIGKFQSVANRIVDMKVRLETARLVLYKLGWTKTTHGRAMMDAAVAKLYLSEAWVQSCLDAVQIRGGYGYMTEYEAERELRDSIASRLYSGTSEIQRNIIARALGL